MDLQDFYKGKAFDAYEFFGAHVQDEGVRFRVYAPQATRVEVIGEFNHWLGEEMENENGIYTFFSREARKGQMYKYRIFQKDGNKVEHADPYGFGMELRPNSASIIVDLVGYSFKDEKWLKTRGKNYNQPMNIYEVHLGSWRTNPEHEEGWYTYSEIGDLLIPYVLEKGYTHIEFLPLSEHPADCSWGYQITGFFSPTSRYGTANQLKELVDRCHQAGIGVIMDFVPVHFAMDYYALARFDGTPLYEYPHEDIGYSEWGSYNFMLTRGEVASFLQSSAHYWLQEFHFDGLRMDAMSNALYWMGNTQRGVNEGAVQFIKGMNEGLHKRHQGVMLIAEDSSAYPKVTVPVEYGGLGFDYKWDMGWMNDTLDFFRLSPEERPKHYHKLTFSMHYFYNELYLLPFSHDEVVHGKATIIQKMWGLYEDKFRQCKVLYMYMYTHPGKKLNFMGNEIGQFREWDEKREQDWDLLTYPKHSAFHAFMTTLNELYLTHPALHQGEYDWRSFKWLVVNAEAECVYMYRRKAAGKQLIVAMNLSQHYYKKFKVRIEEPLILEELLNSDWDIYGGETSAAMRESIVTKNQRKTGQPFYELEIDLKGFSAKIYEAQIMEQTTKQMRCVKRPIGNKGIAQFKK